jgi:hypothetical protein
MKPDIQIVDAKQWHCGQMVRHMRRAHMEAFVRVGLNSHRELRNAVAMSGFCRSLLLDGQLASMWGCGGSLLSPIGMVWVVFTEKAIQAHPVLLLKLTKAQLDEMMLTKDELVTIALEGDEAAIRFMAFLGFHVSHELPGRVAYSKSARRALVRFAVENPDFRVPVGKSYGVRMGYHPEVH